MLISGIHDKKKSKEEIDDVLQKIKRITLKKISGGP